MGWGIGDDTHKHPNKRDVKFEDTVNIKERKSKKTKFVDYSMRIGGVPQFFLEAKQPSKNLKDDKSYSFQIRRYGFSAGLPLNILTDFEELSIYDCRIKPKATDSTKIGREHYFEYKDYVDNWKTVWDLFSREAVENGSLDYYKEEKSSGSHRVDRDFLAYIENWREKLAKNICLRNRDISESHLNYAVQKIIDRIIFLRICESRGIEKDGLLKSAVDKENTYKKLMQIFKNADDKYNSGLFHFRKEEAIGEEADNITPKLIIDANKILNPIIESLYDECPYEFSVFPADILGRVYEQFLGKVISHKENSIKVDVEEKLEVRKAGGVYYTPEYIVKYIVEHTIGSLIDGKKIKYIKQIKVIDPACGSGSFLIVAYQFLLDKYLDLYIEDGAEKYLKGKNPVLFQLNDGSYQLTLEERKKILLNNIYGVDIDAQAVEVTKLSLLLKVLEYEGEEIKQQTLFNGERVLPDLFNNIKCGNSLVESDIGTRVLNLDPKELVKINPFDWHIEFKGIMDNGGFDCVIGNPPYIKEYTSREIFEYVKMSILKKYYQGKMDLWYFFVCHGLDLLKEQGILSFIAPNNWITNAGASILRNKVLQESKIINYVDFGDYKVFSDAGIQTMIFVLQKGNGNKDYKLQISKLSSSQIKENELANYLINSGQNDNIHILNCLISPKNMENTTITFIENTLNQVIDKVLKQGNYFLDNKIAIQGIVPAPDYCFIVQEKDLIKFNSDEKKFIKKYFTSTHRWVDPHSDIYLIYLSAKNFKGNELKKYPNLYSHFEVHKKTLREAKIKYKTPTKPYYFLHRERDESFFKEGEKIVSQVRCEYPKFLYTEEEYYGSRALFFIKPNDINLKYLIGLLNSKLIHFWLKNKGKMQGDLLKIEKSEILKIPLVKLDDKQQVQLLVSLVDKMLSLQKHFHTSTSTQEKSILEKQIKVVDTAINNIVYKLYNLTDEEINLIENSI